MLSQLDGVELQLKARLMAGANVNERDLDGGRLCVTLPLADVFKVGKRWLMPVQMLTLLITMASRRCILPCVMTI